eukprot:TRINITY_DN13111_c0_g2_i4.p4 TRINITY_DN13111_c0_g2~~TRINITY_DN13111_c0_g2_i4.p4  ORF type:complete len:112 (-),score=1.91 TRINITY_DN13111_c0_g2_i4:1432-1767(-)
MFLRQIQAGSLANFIIQNELKEIQSWIRWFARTLVKILPDTSLKPLFTQQSGKYHAYIDMLCSLFTYVLYVICTYFLIYTNERLVVLPHIKLSRTRRFWEILNMCGIHAEQ